MTYEEREAKTTFMWHLTAAIFSLTLLFFGIFAIAQDNIGKEYYLDSYNQKTSICRNMTWTPDACIDVSGISARETVDLVNSLNEKK